MNIEKIKKLEDLRSENSKLLGEYNKLFKARKSEYLENALSEFKSYFEEKSFNLTISGRSIEAKYNTFIVQIIVPDEEEDYFGFISIIDLIINKKKYKICINKKGSENVNVTSSLVPSDKEEKLDYEIGKLEKLIPKTKEKIEKFNETKWVYGLYEDKQQGFREAVYYDSMTELLESTFKWKTVFKLSFFRMKIKYCIVGVIIWKK